TEPDVHAEGVIAHVRPERAQRGTMQADVERRIQVATHIEADEHRRTGMTLAIERAPNVARAELHADLRAEVELPARIEVVDDSCGLDAAARIASLVVLERQAVEHDPAALDGPIHPAELHFARAHVRAVREVAVEELCRERQAVARL